MKRPIRKLTASDVRSAKAGDVIERLSDRQNVGWEPRTIVEAMPCRQTSIGTERTIYCEHGLVHTLCEQTNGLRFAVPTSDELAECDPPPHITDPVFDPPPSEFCPGWVDDDR